MDVVVREARESELAEIGALTAEIYYGLVGAEYLEVLRDARSRWEAPGTTQLVAFDDGTDEDGDAGEPLGVSVYAAAGSPWRDIGVDDEAEIRMLGVRDSARGRGVGEALVRASVALAKAAGSPRVVLSTELEMEDAQRLYERLGFARVPERDWAPRPGLSLLAYALEVSE
jgi:ribosomal protein S18 acetylase RimI-like enzyme